MDKSKLSRTAKYYKRVPLSKRHGGNFDIYELISKYREYACLWDCNCEDYKNKQLRERAWVRIAMYFNTNVGLVKTKMKNLRSAYVAEKNKVDKSLLSSGSPYRPKLFYYKYLNFLDNIVVYRADLEKTNGFEFDNNINQDIENDDSKNFTKTKDIESDQECSQKYPKDNKSTQSEGGIDIVELILKYKDNKCLWDYNCEDYKNQPLKQRAWENIASCFGFEASEIKNKVKHLRSAYVYEKRKVDQYKQRGLKRKPLLFYYKYFRFLDNIVVSRKVSEISSALDQSNDSKRTSTSECDSDDEDELELEQYQPAKRQSSHIDVFELISKYKSYECLWNLRNIDYKNFRLKDKAWKSIARHFGYEVAFVKAKVKNLRSAYMMEKKKVEKSKISGERRHSPMLFYYKKLDFLDNVVGMRKKVDDLNGTNNTGKTLDFESNNDLKESNIFQFENIEINEDCEKNHKIDNFTKTEEIELELPTIQKHSNEIPTAVSPTPSSEIAIPKIISTRPLSTHQHSSRKPERESKLHKAINDVERIDVYNSFGKTIALQLKQLSLDVASITMLEVHSILTKKVLEHYRSSHNGDHNQPTYSTEEESIDDIVQAALNDSDIQ